MSSARHPGLDRDPPFLAVFRRRIPAFAGMTACRARFRRKLRHASRPRLCQGLQPGCASPAAPTSARRRWRRPSSRPTATARRRRAPSPRTRRSTASTSIRPSRAIQGMNSDLNAGEEKGAAEVQFARFASVCRTFAPIYRQMTVGAVAAYPAGRRHRRAPARSPTATSPPPGATISRPGTTAGRSC